MLKHASDEDMLSALEKAQILDSIKEKGGLDAEIEQNGSNLSGGQTVNHRFPYKPHSFQAGHYAYRFRQPHRHQAQ